MKNLIVIDAAKQACKALVFIAKKTDKEGISGVCIETIKLLCSEFDITIFGSLPDNSDAYLPR